MQRRRGRAGHEVSEQPARVRRAMLFLATLAVLLVQIHGATAASCRTTIAAGQYHTCAILDDTTVKCWGWNKNGQLGQGDTKNRGDLSKDEMGDTLPWLDLGNGRTALSVSAGFASTCAVLDDATLKCWGYNTNGELGQGDTSNRGDGTSEMGDKLPPVDLGVNRTAVSVSAGWYHTCAVLDDATVKCWGYNANGELGYGDTKHRGDGTEEMGARLPVVDLGAGRKVAPAFCSACPAGSYSTTTAGDITTCTLCPAGRYSASSGLAECAACTAGSYSAAAGASTSTACTPCLAGTYSPAASGTCTSCPEFASSAAGSATAADCVCNPGYTASKDECMLPVLPATPEEETAIITFEAAVKMGVPAFDVPAVRAKYIAGVADALDRAPGDVRIISIVAAPSRRRASDRSLVDTAVTVAAEDAVSVASGVTADNLNSVLASRGITVAEVADVKVSGADVGTSRPVEEECDGCLNYTLFGVIAGVCALLCCGGGVAWWCAKGRKTEQRKAEENARIHQNASSSITATESGSGLHFEVGDVHGEIETNPFNVDIEINPYNSCTMPKQLPNVDETVGDNLGGSVVLAGVNLADHKFFGTLEPTSSWISNHHKFMARKLILGHPAQAAEGVKELLGLQNLTVFGNLLKQSVDAIESEFHQHGDKNDKENLRYCLYGKALDDAWLPSKVKMDIQTGLYHGGTLEEGEFDMGHQGMSLDDFVNHDRSKLGKLGREHVLALRLYTTSSFSLFNDPLRTGVKGIHPLRMSVYYLDEALRKLRAVRASLDAIAFASESVLWRGMRDTVVTNPEEFHEQGGTELAAMSTTENKDVALQYADSDRPLLFKFNAKGMSMGVDISYLSVYPLEREVLYPPLTYLMSRGPPEMEGNVTIFSVEPSIS